MALADPTPEPRGKLVEAGQPRPLERGTSQALLEAAQLSTSSHLLSFVCWPIRSASPALLRL